MLLQSQGQALVQSCVHQLHNCLQPLTSTLSETSGGRTIQKSALLDCTCSCGNERISQTSHSCWDILDGACTAINNKETTKTALYVLQQCVLLAFWLTIWPNTWAKWLFMSPKGASSLIWLGVKTRPEDASLPHLPIHQCYQGIWPAAKVGRR